MKCFGYKVFVQKKQKQLFGHQVLAAVQKLTSNTTLLTALINIQESSYGASLYIPKHSHYL